MNYLSYDVLSLLSSSLKTATVSNHDKEISMKDDGYVAKQQTLRRPVDDDSTKTPINELIPSTVCRNIPMSSNINDMEFQIRSTIHSWSFCWNRGDIVGYCDAYNHRCKYNSSNDDDTRYTSISRHGKMTTIIGSINITKFFTTVFQQCETYQSKVVRETSDAVVVSKVGVAGYLEYSNLQIQYIPSTTSNSNSNEDEVPIAKNHAVVFGHYTLEYSANNGHSERGIFTLHLVQHPSTVTTSATLSSSKWCIQSEHSSAIQ
jgi:hypothetical protein